MRIVKCDEFDSRTISAFGDEISPDLEVQLTCMAKLGVPGLDLRTAFGKNVLELTDDEVDRVADALYRHRLVAQAIGSPVNKVPYTAEGRSREFEQLERACAIAKRLAIRRIRIFSPETPHSARGETNDPLWPEVRAWISDQVALAQDEDVVLMHENDGRFFGAYPSNSKLLFEEFGCEHFRALFDFGNSVLIGCRTMRDWFPWLLPYLDTLHIKDAREAENRFVFAGEGDGEVGECLAFLFENAWNGPLTIEPHAEVAGPFGGFSGEVAFEHAVSALRRVLSSIPALKS